MSIKKKILISTIAVLTLVLGGVMVTHADGDTPSAEDLLSTGRTEIDVDNDGIPDAVFDAKDLKDIATSVENGKSSLATSINAYPNADVAPLATFPELSSAIDNLTAVPDIYYYDKATEGDSCVRYMYEDGSYYPCNEYGEKTSDTALSGTITVVTKDDTTEPAAGEIQLVKYESTSAANLSAGSAGFADKSFILGSGSDNITYRNLGFTEGMASTMENTDIQYTYHEHQGEPSINGGCYTTPVYHSHVGSCYSQCTGTIYSLNSTATQTQWRCNKCGWQAYIDNVYNTKYGDRCKQNVLSCTSGGTIVSYSLGCGKTTDTVESATIIFN